MKHWKTKEREIDEQRERGKKYIVRERTKKESKTQRKALGVLAASLKFNQRDLRSQFDVVAFDQLKSVEIQRNRVERVTWLWSERWVETVGFSRDFFFLGGRYLVSLYFTLVATTGKQSVRGFVLKFIQQPRSIVSRLILK